MQAKYLQFFQIQHPLCYEVEQKIEYHKPQHYQKLFSIQKQSKHHLNLKWYLESLDMDIQQLLLFDLWYHKSSHNIQGLRLLQ